MTGVTRWATRDRTEPVEARWMPGIDDAFATRVETTPCDEPGTWLAVWRDHLSSAEVESLVERMRQPFEPLEENVEKLEPCASQSSESTAPCQASLVQITKAPGYGAGTDPDQPYDE